MYNLRDVGGTLTNKNFNLADMEVKVGTTRNDLSGAIQQAVQDITALLYQSKLIDYVRKVPMDSPSLKIPAAYNASGYASTQSESSGKGQSWISGDVVRLDVATEASFVELTNQAMKSVPAFTTLVPQMLASQIASNLEGKITAAIKAASGKTQYNVANVSGKPEHAELLDAYSHLLDRADGRKIMVAHPVIWAHITAQMNTSGMAGLVTRDAAGNIFFLDAEIVKSPIMTAPASGASGTFPFVNANYIALGQYGEVANAFNPYYGWTTNTSSIRLEGEFAVAPMSNRSLTISGYVFSDIVVQN